MESSQYTLLPLETLKPSSVNVRIVVNPEAVRKLAEDIAARGLLHPLIVRPEGGGYGVVCGRMRLEAIRLLQREKPEAYQRLFARGIPCVVKELGDREALELSLAENIRQNTLTPEEVGRGLARLYEMGLSEEEIRQRLLVEVDTIRRAIKLYSRIAAALDFTAESKPGRPPQRSIKRKVSRAGLSTVARVVEQLQLKGAAEVKPEEVVRRVAELSEGKLSTGELRLVAERIKRDPSVAADENKLKSIINEIIQVGYVERVVLLRKDLINKIEDLAEREGISFDEELNKILERALLAP